MNSNHNKFLIFVVLIFAIFALQISCLAEETEYITLVSSTVVDGDVEVPTNSTIELIFSGNIDDISVANYNKECFFLYDSANNIVPITLILPDTQMQNAFKKQAFIMPNEPLNAGETYKLVIDHNLKDKNGLKLEKSLEINFTTSTNPNESTTVNEDLSKIGEYTTKYNVDNNREITTVNQETPNETTTQEDQGGSLKGVVPVFIAIIAAIICAITVLIANKKKNN